MLAGRGPAEVVPDADVLAVLDERVVVVGAAGRRLDVQAAAPSSSSTVTASADRRIGARVGCTP